jgi:hypothetical protein
VTSKAAALADAVSVNEATASVDTFDTTTGGSTTSGSGVSVTLTTNVETATGTAFDDFFAANLTNTGASLNDGDQINGGSGTDTLSLVAQGANAVAFLNGVENIDVRLLSAQTLEAVGWSGVSKVEVVNTSIDDKTLTINNANQSTQFKISDDANVVVSYLDESGSGDIARLAVDNGGVSGSAATFTISGTEAVTLGASGTSFVTVSAADSALKDITVSGVGTLEFSVSETSISGLSLAQFSGTSTVTLGAASDVRLIGGTGADTFKFGSTFNGLDTVNGGAGSDSLSAEIAGIVSFGNVSNVETLNATGGSTLVADLNGASFSTINLLQVSGASTDVTFNNIGTVTLNLAAASGQRSDLALDYSGTNAVINFRQSGGAVQYSSLAITDASGITLDRSAASGTVLVSALDIDSDGKSLTVNASSGSFTLSAVSGDGLTSLTTNVAGSGTFSNSTAVGSGLTSVTVNANASNASNTLGGLSLNTGSHSVTVAASGDQAAATIGAVGFSFSGTETVSLTAVGSGAAARGGNFTSGSTLTLSARADGASAVANVDNLSTTSSAGATITLGASGAAASGDIGTITLGTAGTTTINVNLSGDANGQVGDVTGVTADAVTLNVRSNASGDFTFSALELTYDAAGAAVSAGTTLTLNLGLTSGDLTISSAQATTVTISGVAVAAQASAQFTQISANTIGSITFGGSGVLGVGTVVASGIGAISISDGLFSGALNAKTIGAITVAGDGVNIVASATTSIGNISVGATNSGSVSITNANTSGTFGNIVIGGGGSVTIDLGGASGLGTVSTVGKSGQFTLDGTSAQGKIVASLGAGSNDITVSLAGSAAGVFNGDLYTLTANTGADYFRFAFSGNQDVSITNFQLASATDRIYVGTAGVDLGFGSAAIDNASGVISTVSVLTGSTSATTGVLVLRSGTFADAADLASGLAAGRFAVSAGSTTAGVTAGNDFVVLWADTNGDTHLSLVTTQVSAGAGDRVFSAITSANVVDLAFLDDVNVATFSGTSYTDKFWLY